MFWDGLYSRAALWEACRGVPFRGDAGLYRFSLVRSEKLDFYVLAGIMGEIGFLWDGRIGWDGGGMEGTKLAGVGSGTPPLSLEVRTTGSGRCRREAVAATNCASAVRARSIFVRPAE